MPKLVICDKMDTKVLGQVGDLFDIVDASGVPKQELPKLLKDADCVVVRSSTKVGADLITQAPRLKLILRAGVGLDNVDLEAAKARGIRVLNTPAAATNSAAELTIGLMLALARGVIRGDRGIRQAHWLKNEIMGFELAGKTLGIVGYGRIGSRVASLSGCLGMKVLAWKPSGSSGINPPAKYSDLNGLLTSSDVVTLHIPLTAETRHFFDDEKFRLMKEGALLINTSRGEVVDEQALIRALSDNRIGGAALDVFDKEPYTGRLTEFENVVLTPHIGANTREAQERVAAEIVSLLRQEAATLK